MHYVLYLIISVLGYRYIYTVNSQYNKFQGTEKKFGISKVC